MRAGSLGYLPFPMTAKDIMHAPAVTIGQDETVARLCDLLQEKHVNGAPVIDEGGELVGIVTEEDVLYGSMGSEDGEAPEGEARTPTLVRDIMTSPAVCATEDTEVVEICELMWQMRIHRVPIVKDGKVTGIVAAMDVVRAVAERRLTP